MRKSTLNKIIDEIFHKDDSPISILIDTALHFAVEKDPLKSLTKFFRYNYPRLIKSIKKRRR